MNTAWRIAFSTAVKRSARPQYQSRHNMTRFAVPKSQKIKPLMKKEALTLSICGKVPIYLPLTLSNIAPFCFVTVFSRTSFCKHFELIQIFKALATGCDVGFCVWPVCYPQWSNAARVRNMTRFNAGKSPGSLKNCSKSEKIKPLLEREAL